MNPIMYWMDPREVADYCFDVVIPGMEDKHKAVLSDYYFMISDLLADHQIDSLRAQWIDANTFVALLEQQASSDSDDLCWSAMDLWSALQEKLRGNDQNLPWKHIVNAVRHEMTNAIAQIVESVSSKLEISKNSSAKRLIKAIKRKGERTLTDAEARYLRSLVNRVKNEMILTPLDHS